MKADTAKKGGAVDKEDDDEDGEKMNPFKKRKVALFIAYVGAGYSGMQVRMYTTVQICCVATCALPSLVC